MTTATHGPMAGLARRVGCTHGQAYTLLITLTLAIVCGLAGVSPVAQRQPAAAASPPASVARPASDAQAGVGGTIPPSSGTNPPPWTVAPGAPTPSSRPAPVPPTPNDDEEDKAPAPDPCTSTETLATSEQVLGALHDASGGAVPNQSTQLLLAHLTGCEPSDPTILVISLLAELGGGLPDTGIEIPALPLPYPVLPPALVELVQPLRPAFDPLCGGVGATTQLFFYGLSTYPLGIGGTSLALLSNVLVVCGQLQQLEANP